MADNYDAIPGWPNWKKHYIESAVVNFGSHGAVSEDFVERSLKRHLKVLYGDIIPYEYMEDSVSGDKIYTDQVMDPDEIQAEIVKISGETRTVRVLTDPTTPWDPSSWGESEPIPTKTAAGIQTALDMAEAMQALLTKWSKRAIINEHKNLHQVKRFFFEPSATGEALLKLMTRGEVGEAGGSDHWWGSSAESTIEETGGTMIALAGINTDEEPFD